MYILANGRLITRSADTPYLPDGGVVIDGTKIKEVGTTSDLKKKYPDAEFVDANRLGASATKKIIAGDRDDPHKCCNCGNCKAVCPSGNVEIRKKLY